MIKYFTDFYGPTGGLVVMWLIALCIGAVAGILLRILVDRRKR